jgi:hypothetical protein
MFQKPLDIQMVGGFDSLSLASGSMTQRNLDIEVGSQAIEPSLRGPDNPEHSAGDPELEWYLNVPGKVGHYAKISGSASKVPKSQRIQDI